MIKIGGNILQKRKERGITQEELAEFMMVTKASVSKWETGQSHPDILLLPKLATFFNISVDDLIGYDPDLSSAQIKKIYIDLENRVLDAGMDSIVEDIEIKIKQYYSCFELLYYMALFILNHCDLATDDVKKEEYLEYANNILKRVCEDSKDPILKDQSLSLRAACLISLGKPEEALNILPSSDMLSISKDCLVASAYLKTKEENKVDQKLQVMIYKNIIDLITLLMMKSSLHDDDRVETLERVEDLIETFNLIEINVSIVLNFYLSLATHYIEYNNPKLSIQYVEKLLNLLIKSKEKSFNIRGDEYFDQIDKWIDENLLLSTKPNRSDDMIARSYIGLLTNNESFKDIIIQEKIKLLVDKVKEIYSF
ncbi:helix-turn-helix transcriptional regulator [Anaerococcus sp. mt242]|uniref:helix-turn-helix domain-containing protein n=1 Tax=Anaerococcus sp. mt242 TaxID=2661917 RepID=UPI001931C69D|nr:helix-turn-helix transcriptional regulator [Anaerococcus sp. mt242]MBM0045985.1 helix-turn-helix transcriptional regulator [Anaerococcus sp. mt242]